MPSGSAMLAPVSASGGAGAGCGATVVVGASDVGGTGGASEDVGGASVVVGGGGGKQGGASAVRTLVKPFEPSASSWAFTSAVKWWSTVASRPSKACSKFCPNCV